MQTTWGGIAADELKKLLVREAGSIRSSIGSLLLRDYLNRLELAIYCCLIALQCCTLRFELLLLDSNQIELLVHRLVEVSDEVMELLHTKQSRYQILLFTCALRCDSRKVIYAVFLNEAESIGL